MSIFDLIKSSGTDGPTVSHPIVQITPKLAWNGEEVILLPEGDFFRADDEPHIKVLSWLYANFPPGKRLPIDRARIADDCKLSDQDVRGAIARLVKEGDLEPGTNRGRETFILRIQYHSEGDQL